MASEERPDWRGFSQDRVVLIGAIKALEAALAEEKRGHEETKRLLLKLDARLRAAEERAERCTGKPRGDGSGLGPDGGVEAGDPAHCVHCRAEALRERLREVEAEGDVQARGKESALARLREVEGALQSARRAIDSLPEEVLGVTHDTRGERWPIKAELLSKIDAALLGAESAGPLKAQEVAEELADKFRRGGNYDR